MMRLAILSVDFTIQFQLNVVSSIFCIGVTGEGQTGGLQVKIDFGGVRCGDRDVDVVLFRVGIGRTLGPEDFWSRGFR